MDISSLDLGSTNLDNPNKSKTTHIEQLEAEVFAISILWVQINKSIRKNMFFQVSSDVATDSLMYVEYLLWLGNDHIECYIHYLSLCFSSLAPKNKPFPQ